MRIKDDRTLCARFVRDCTGQDLIEYTLMAGFIAISAGALLPNLTPGFSSIFSRLGSVLAVAAR